MRIESKYIACDGKEFKNRWECQDYEDELAQPRREALKDFVLFFNSLGKLIPYSSRREPSFVFVKQLPSDAVNHIFEEVAPEYLYNAVWTNQKTGWYYQGECDVWYSLDAVREEVKNTENSINKIIKTNEDLF